MLAWIALALPVACPPFAFPQAAQQAELDRWSQQARRAMTAKDWPEAQRALERLAALEPAVAEVQANLGLVYFSQNRVYDAADAFERALKLNPSLPHARVMLGLCDAELGRNTAAVNILAPAFAKASNDELGRRVGLALLRAESALGDDVQAVRVAGELQKRFPNDPEVLFEASRFYADRSYGLMKRLLSLPGDSPWARFANAEVYESEGRYDEAIEEYQSVAKMAPGMPNVHFRIGRVLLMKSQDAPSVDAAQREFEQELAVSPQNAEAEYELGEIARHRAEFEQAVEHFTRAVRYHPEFAEAEIGLARSLISLGRSSEALAPLQVAVRSEPENEVPHYLLASVYRKQGDAWREDQEMATFEKLRAARHSVVTPHATTVSGVTPQTLDSDSASHP